MREVEVRRQTTADPAAVWALVADPVRMGEWSPEVVASEWIGGGGAGGAAVGRRFRGSNRRGWRRWSTTSTVTDLVDGHRIAWDVSIGPLSVATWSYEVVPADSGSTVVERFEDRRGRVITVVGTAVRGVRDVETHNRQLMHTTLERLCAAAEGATA